MIGIGNALPSLAAGPDADFAVAGNLDNIGTIAMSNRIAGDRMTVSGGTYTSSGGKLLIDTVLNQGGAASSSDMPIADSTTLGAKGPNASARQECRRRGRGDLRQWHRGGPGHRPTHSAAGAFTLLGRVVAGPYEYKLNQGGAQSADGNWYLSSEQAPHASGSTYATYPPDPPTPPAPPTPLYRSEVAAYLANQHVAGQMFVRSLDDRSSGGNGAPALAPSLSVLPEDVWIRVVGSNEGTNSNSGVFGVSTDSFLMQGGIEAYQARLAGSADLLHIELLANYTTARSDAQAAGNPASAHGDVQGYGVGAYATWYQSEQSRLGPYADTWTEYGWFNNSVTGDELRTVKYNARGWAISGELG